MTLEQRIKSYKEKTGFPESLFISEDRRIIGIWIMGNNYKVASKYYGGYPHGYLKRIYSLFPDKKNILHLFSGKVNNEIFPGDTFDINENLNPTYVGDAHELSKIVKKKYDLILADPPYSVEDCEHYGTCMINRNKVLKECEKIMEIGSHLVWLDQVLPMYKKSALKTIGYIGMVKSTNHRFRIITIFEKI
ncbi:MAG: protein-lysine N-methyltransferase [Candidatus Dojkabacteria bacterium]|nr:protein-lysine N-methyltransferase [Candidatus Dojkabacteria bacterium]